MKKIIKFTLLSCLSASLVVASSGCWRSESANKKYNFEIYDKKFESKQEAINYAKSFVQREDKHIKINISFIKIRINLKTFKI